MAFIYTDLHPGWKPFFDTQCQQPYFVELERRLEQEWTNYEVHPAPEQVFRVFQNHGPSEPSCLILGQDPYPSPGMATGLAFSVAAGQKLPASLRNLFKEYQSDLGRPAPANGDLEAWAAQGVFLLNTALTVRTRQAGAHLGWGWEQFTLAAIVYILEQNSELGFICFGKPAEKRVKLALAQAGVAEDARTLICTPHPSPLSAYRGFFGSKPFSSFNEAQQKKGRKVVSWNLPDKTAMDLFS